jgi:hypothetical protein
MTDLAFVIFCCLIGVYANSQKREWGWWILWSVLFSPIFTAIALFILGKKE